MLSWAAVALFLGSLSSPILSLLTCDALSSWVPAFGTLAIHTSTGEGGVWLDESPGEVAVGFRFGSNGCGAFVSKHPFSPFRATGPQSLLFFFSSLTFVFAGLLEVVWRFAQLPAPI